MDPPTPFAVSDGYPIGEAAFGWGFETGGHVLRLVMSPDGKSLVSTSSDRTIKLWDPAHVAQRLQAVEVARGRPHGDSSSGKLPHHR